MISDYKGKPVHFRLKDDLWVWRWLAKVFPPLGSFWTTTLNTIWLPLGSTQDRLREAVKMQMPVVRHELVHVEQWRSLGVLFWIGYCLPYFRWRFERVAYKIQIEEGVFTPEQVADILWRNYLWPWPRRWMVKWFYKHLR